MSREAKAGLLALGLLGLLFLVTLGARGGHPGSDGEVTPRAVPATVQDSFVTLLAVLYVVAIVAAIFVFFAYKGKWKDPKDRHWLRNYVLVMVVMGIATLFGYYAITHGYLKGKDQTPPVGASQGQQTQTQRQRVRSVPVRQARFQWPLVFGLAGIVLLGGAVVYLRRRRSFEPIEERTLEEDLAIAVGVSIDDLRNEPDARRAVVGAYAQMERVLSVHGLARREADAPVEYLMRILRELEVRESAVRSLTELFEYAKFSPHEIDAGMKEQAIEALAAVRDDLRASEPVPA